MNPIKELTYQQAHIIASTLGINLYHAKNSKGKSDKVLPAEFYRNKFVSPAPDPIIDDLETMGLMGRYEKTNEKGWVWWFVTEEGEKRFREAFPSLVRSDIPILYSTPMVQSIQNGRKTNTRRVVKPQPGFDRMGLTSAGWVYKDGLWHYPEASPEISIKCPYGQIGDTHWVRETWCELVPEHVGKSKYVYRADLSFTDGDGERCRQDYIKAGFPYHWKPSIFMPKEACRIWLRIKDIRIERLQDISEEDALSEGVERCTVYLIDTKQDALRFRDYTSRYDLDHPKHRWLHTAKDSFRSLWQKINGWESWRENPWVWRIEFERIAVEKPAEE
ncbi:hypothetical protein [Tellurirhabdus bombi]|uniref:hypothetical protein n=1 Tax=Tellurirhabdus bombi TaxID=2907205 RepID=UPI001F21C9DA|nr:hypothetical protein [Tellurirhabdus bombi]